MLTQPDKTLLVPTKLDVGSLALLVGLVERNIEPDRIVLVGRPYGELLAELDEWLDLLELPRVEVLAPAPGRNTSWRIALERALKRELPGLIALGYPDGVAVGRWAKTEGIPMLAGWEVRFPLHCWGWGEAECRKAVNRAGLEVSP